MAASDVRKAIAIGEGERLWNLYNISTPQELVLEDIALARGVIVTEGALEKMEARLVRQGNRGLIRVKAGLPETGRKRFAIAHEMGHWELHRDVSQWFACTADNMVLSYKSLPHESEANLFAAGLLMPETFFRQETGSREFCYATISDLASVFSTSLTATAIRYVDISYDYVAVVASNADGIRWFRGSARFEESCWINVKSKLSSNSMAAEMLHAGGATRVADPVEVDAEVWVEKKGDTEVDTLIEESVFMAPYGQVLSLLRLP